MNKVIQGDSLQELKNLKENSVDTLITDPPYGLSFMGKKWDYDVPGVELWKECLRVLKPGGTALIFAGSRTQHRMAVNVEDAGFILKDTIMWLYGSGFPKATDISKQLDKMAGETPKLVGYREDFQKRARKNGVESKDYVLAGGWEATEDKVGMITEPATPEAKLWNGWKSHGLKPAYEPILVCQKPNDGTYANNALKWGVSGLNIDGGRIGFNGEKQPTGSGSPSKDFDKKSIQPGRSGGNGGNETSPDGRFPANIILDEEAGKMLDEQSGMEASRFFYCAKASKSERNAGCEESNSHPTVKPLKLMEYLCTITKTPTGGVVLDPFAGSGTTGLAAQNTGRDYILIEREEEYIPIINARLKQLPT